MPQNNHQNGKQLINFRKTEDQNQQCRRQCKICRHDQRKQIIRNRWKANYWSKYICSLSTPHSARLFFYPHQSATCMIRDFLIRLYVRFRYCSVIIETSLTNPREVKLSFNKSRLSRHLRGEITAGRSTKASTIGRISGHPVQLYS